MLKRKIFHKDEEQNQWMYLPRDVACFIFSFVPIDEVSSFVTVCKQWKIWIQWMIKDWKAELAHFEFIDYFKNQKPMKNLKYIPNSKELLNCIEQNDTYEQTSAGLFCHPKSEYIISICDDIITVLKFSYDFHLQIICQYSLGEKEEFLYLHWIKKYESFFIFVSITNENENGRDDQILYIFELKPKLKIKRIPLSKLCESYIELILMSGMMLIEFWEEKSKKYKFKIFHKTYLLENEFSLEKLQIIEHRIFGNLKIGNSIYFYNSHGKLTEYKKNKKDILNPLLLAKIIIPTPNIPYSFGGLYSVENRLFYVAKELNGPNREIIFIYDYQKSEMEFLPIPNSSFIHASFSPNHLCVMGEKGSCQTVKGKFDKEKKKTEFYFEKGRYTGSEEKISEEYYNDIKISKIPKDLSIFQTIIEIPNFHKVEANTKDKKYIGISRYCLVTFENFIMTIQYPSIAPKEIEKNPIPLLM